MKKFIRNIAIFFASLFRGMKSADETIVPSQKDNDNGSPAEEKKMEETNLYASLLKGEVTQEVKDLRYETYESVRQSKDWKPIGYSGVAVKRNHMQLKPPMKLDEEDGLKIVLIQDNKIFVDGRDEALKNIQKAVNIKNESDAEHTFKITYHNPPRHKLETFAKKVVVKTTEKENQFKLDFYLSEYPIENAPKAVYVVKELESLYNSGSRTCDLIDISSLTFTTDKAYGDDDWKIYNFNINSYIGIKKFDGNYVISFLASLPNGIKDIVEEYKDEESVKKFENKTPRKGKVKTITLADAKDVTEQEEKKIDTTKAVTMAKKVKATSSVKGKAIVKKPKSTTKTVNKKKENKTDENSN